MQLYNAVEKSNFIELKVCSTNTHFVKIAIIESKFIFTAITFHFLVTLGNVMGFSLHKSTSIQYFSDHGMKFTKLFITFKIKLNCITNSYINPYCYYFISGASVTISSQEYYLYEGRYITALVYFVLRDGVVMIPATLPEVSVSSLAAAIDFKSVHDTTFVILENIELSLASRVSYSAMFYLSRPIQTTDIVSIETGLRAAWQGTLVGVVSVVIENQEAVTKLNG